MSVETLENLLKNPDIWDISLSTQNMHDVLVEIASRVDSLMAGQNIIKPSNNDNEEQILDVHDLTSRVDTLSKQVERQNTDFGSEIQDLRALFNFQLRDIREKMDRNITSIKDSMSRPSTPPPAVIQQIPDTDANFETERKLHSLSKDISYLKDRTRAILTVLKDLPEIQSKMVADEENKNSENKESKTDVEPTSSNKLLLDGETDVDLTSQTSNLNPDDPLAPSDDDPFSTNRIKDSRIDDIIEEIDFMKKERKNDTERLNSTIKAVNQLIAEKDNSTNKVNQCVRDSKRFNDEFDRLYQKMAEFQVEVDKKISEALNVRINTDIKTIPMSSNNQQMELPSLKEGFSSDIAQMDSNYMQQINYLKLEISQLRQALSDRMLLPSSRANDAKSSISRSNVEVQTDESLADAIPTRHANVDVQKTRVANEIMTQVIVSRTPIQYMAINQEYVNMMKRFQPQSSQQAGQQSTEKPKPVKRQRRPVSTSSIEIQTNEENAKDQPDVNPPNDEESENRNISSSSSSQSKAGSSSKKMRSSHSNRKVTYIDSTTETQAEISGIGSPLRTPPRTPLRSQNQKRKVELITLYTETDPEITGEPLGITPDLLEQPDSSSQNQKNQNESGSEEEEKSQNQQNPKSPIKVESEATGTENVNNQKKKRKKSTKGKDSQKDSQTTEKVQNQDESQQEEEESSQESGQIDNVGTEARTKTPKIPPKEIKNNQNQNQNETETNQSTSQNDQKQKESEAQSKAGTPQTAPGSQKVSRTETPLDSEKQQENENEKDQNQNQSQNQNQNQQEESHQPITTNKNIKRKKEKVIYADSGISMQINTYEKEIIERDGQNDDEPEEIEVVDIEIQTDDISEEELSMYSIFNQEQLSEMGDMTYMERYSTSGANTNIGLGNISFQNQNQNQNQTQNQQVNNGSYYSYKPNPVFSFERLLNLTIISDINKTDQPHPILKVPDSSKEGQPSSSSQSQSQSPSSESTISATFDASQIDVQAIINKVLELSKDKNIDAMNDQINRHSRQITTLFKLVDEVKDSNTAASSSRNDRQKSAPGNRIESNGASSSRDSRIGSGIGSKATTPNQNQQQQNQDQQQEQDQNQNQNQEQIQHQLQVQPGFTPSNPVVIADMMPNPNQTLAQVPPDLIERLDQFDDSIADLEDHLFSIEKKLIDKGALRPNSANPYGDDYSASPFGPSIRPDSNSNNNNNNYNYEAYREPSGYRRHHHHHHSRHGTGNNNNDQRSGEYENPESAHGDQNQDGDNRGDLQPNNNEHPQDNISGSDNSQQNQQQQQPQQQQGQTSPNHVVSISSGPDKPRSNYYNQFTPGSLSKERNQNAKKETLEFIQGFTIDPDPEAMKPVEKEVVIPEDLTIPKYERQLRLLREAVVELRTNIQILRVKTDQPVIIQPTENVEPEPEEKNENTVDETTLRALRKKIELAFDDYSSQIADIRRELYLHLEQPPDRIIEVRTEVQKVEKPKDEEENNKKESKPAPAAPKDINVDLNLSKAIEMLADTQHKSVISIHKIELPPEVKEHRDLVQRLQNNNPIIENNHNNNQGAIKPTSDLLQPPPPSNDISGGQQRRDENDQQIDYTALPPPASTPLVTTMKNEGHFVPQIVQDMRVLNAMPKKDMLELLMPFLYQLRSELLMNIDSNTERIRCLENSVQSKVEKEFIESFFRKIRMAVKEADDKAMKACNSLFDKVSKQDLEDRVQELLKQIGTQETTVAGKTSYTCLFCGAKKTTLAKSSAAIEKGKLFKGRATRQSLQSSDLSQLPPLSENE